MASSNSLISSPARFWFALVCPLFLFTTMIIQPSCSFIENYTSSSALLHVTVFDETGTVYVSGTNILLQFTEKFKKEKEMSTGPVHDNDQCLPAPASCQTPRVPMNNSARVLEVGDNLLVCGSTRQGLCTVHSLADITSFHDMEADNPLNFLGGKNRTFAFFSNTPKDFASKVRKVLYAAVTYDDRPINLAPKMFSTRKIVRKEDTFNAEYLYSDAALDRYSAIDASSIVKQQYIIQTVFGFELRNFIYFLTVQPTKINSQVFHTRLGRVCKDSVLFVNYIEIPLECKNSDGQLFNIAMAAWVHMVTDQLSARRLGVSGQESMLYVTFGRSHHGSSLPDPELGSAVCVYRMKNVRASFIGELRNCYAGARKSHWLDWVVGSSINCKSDSEERKRIKDDDTFCSDLSATNHAIEGSRSIQQKANYTVSNRLLTTVAVTTRLNTTITVLGRDDGVIMKLLSHKLAEGPYAEYNLSRDPNIGVEKDVAFDKATKNLYILTGNTVHKFSLDSCRIHETCGSCVNQSGDPLPCGWCGDKCTLEYDTKNCKAPWHNDRCMPTIDDVTPLTGPTKGGTRITIRGSNFGSNDPAASVSVNVGKTMDGSKRVDCPISSRNVSQIICTTSGTLVDSDEGVITVNVRDYSRTIVKYNIDGDAVYSQIFKYKKAELNKFSPLMGPVSGGTLLTISGQNLNIGSEIDVTAAHVLCNIIQITNQKIVCNTSSVSDNARKRRNALPLPYIGKVQVDIDEIEKLLSKEDYTFMNDPVITSIGPKRSFLSGGVKVTVTGENFHVIQRPRLGITVDGKRSNTSLEPCEARPGGRSMVCNSPNITSLITRPIDSSEPLQVNFWFEMDGVQNVLHLDTEAPQLSQFSYYPDPVFEKFASDDHLYLFDISTDFLHLLGENLNLGYNQFDLHIRIGNSGCNITTIKADRVICTPANKPTDVNTNEPKRKVEVEVGYLVFDIGHLQFTSTTVVNAGIVALIAVLIIVVLLIIVLIIIMRWKRVWPFAEKSDLPVNYTAGQEITSIEDYGTGQRMYNLRNDYHSAGQGGTVPRSPGSAAESRTGFGQDDDIIILLREQKMLIDRDWLDLGDVIGQGHFGCVYKGSLLNAEGNEEMKVAVKTLHKDNPREIDVNGFLNEALIMKDFNHPNILTLIGICLGKDEMPLVVLPFMKHGDVLTYVRDEGNNPTVKDLIMFAVDIAMGMQYLGELKFVHRDLAARNCMLGDTMMVKVADFGLSRDIYEKDYYSSDNKKTKLPVKWMSMESLEKGTYNSKTDVWSFGVVLWELMTRGVNPYPEVDNWDVIRYLRAGRRMPQPTYCPDGLYQIMVHCWSADPDERPTFAALTTDITQMVAILEQNMQQGKMKTNISNTYVNVNNVDYHYAPKAETDV